MKICVLVPSEEYRQNAGARIRYGRLVERLDFRGAELELVEIGQFDAAASGADVMLISKCHDARAQLVAREARRRGIRVGVDLFDDYFSQRHDPRLTRFRRWLSVLAPSLSFALTSTVAMGEVASAYLPDVPILVVNDAAATGSSGEMIVASADAIEAKRSKALDEERLRVAWFGIGDNPYFAVGLTDLAAHAGELASLARLSGMAISLTILTNARALTADGMARIAGLPVSYKIEEWSEEAEAALLRDSFACFLPVNAQGFSAAKSLNRAVTALTAGCQILSAGYPLYAPVGEFIYRDAQSLASDLGTDDLRVSANQRDELIAALGQWACADREADALIAFLSALPDPQKLSPGRVALVHGASTNDATNKLARAIGDVTVASPYAPPKLAVDVRSRALMPMAVDLSASEAAAGATPSGQGRHIDLAKSGLGIQLALYGPVMAGLRSRLKADLGVNEIIVSENSSLPFSLSC